jgi:3-hydroxyacyl-CoA dehydrogenase/enoyl-CoA hydratase/3-hydroxybutyryl-CoA epimerase
MAQKVPHRAAAAEADCFGAKVAVAAACTEGALLVGGTGSAVADVPLPHHRGPNHNAISRVPGTAMTASPPTVRLEIDADRIATVWLDAPGRPVNTLSTGALADLEAIVARLEVERPVAVVFASAKAGFCGGADLAEIRDLDDPALDRFLAAGQSLLDRIAALPVATVAALGGDALGGGLELALACRDRVAADDPRLKLGLPETTLGIVPGWAGTLRLPRVVGLAPALKLLVTGRTVAPEEALAIGLVDEIVPRERLLDTAWRRAVAAAPRAPQPDPLAGDAAARAAECDRVRAETLKRSGDHLPAPLRVIDLVEASYPDAGPDAAAAERRALVELRRTSACRNLVRLFFLRTGGRKAAARLAGGTPRPVATAAVIGGGTMGAGIAQALARSGIDVRVIEADAAAASAAAGRIGAGGPALEVTTDWSRVAAADLVVEAVVERLPVKVDVFRRLEGLVRPDAVLATNTSSLSVAAIAAATARPDRVIGLHFFNPVAKMPLVEVVRPPQATADVVATGVAVAGAAGKTPVLCADAPGFVVNRVLFPQLREALVLFEEGASVVATDAAIRGWGLPMGPFMLIDEIGLDVTQMILESLAAELGPRFAPPPALARALAQGWLGRKSGRGFYDHPRDGRPAPSAALAPTSATAPAATAEAIQRRLIEPMAAEARLVLEAGVVDSADAIDLATVLGLGFAPFRGGLATYAGLAPAPRG